MARIRTIKPEFWADEKLSLLDVTARLVFLGLISMADDAGRLIDNVKLIDGMLFPSTDDTCRDALDTLARLSRITRYRSASGQSLIQIAKWEEHQKVDKPSRYVLPGPETAVLVQPRVPEALAEPVANDSRDSRESLAKPSRSDLGPRTMDLRPRTEDQGAGAPPTPRRVYPAWVADVRARWRKTVGRITPAVVERELAEAVDEHGLEAILIAIDTYSAARLLAGKERVLEWFAKDVVQWIERGGPLVDGDGILTERGMIAAGRP